MKEQQVKDITDSRGIKFIATPFEAKFGVVLETSAAKSLPSHTIMDKIFETNSSFHEKGHTTGKVQFLFFRSFFASINQIIILGGKLSTRI